MMEWLKIFTILGTNLALFIWAITEDGQDRRDMNNRLEAALKAISDEMKDFHGRLCEIEEKNKR